MKNFISFVFLTALLVSPNYSLALSSKDILVSKSYLKFVNQKPQSSYIKYVRSGLNSKTDIIKGLATLILYKHFGNKYFRFLTKNFSLNKKHVNFQRNQRGVVK